MKNLITAIAIFVLSNLSGSLIAQDVNRNFGIGLQKTAINLGLSIKYGVSDNIVLQGIVAPWSASAFGASISLNYYGGKLIYRFPGEERNSAIVLDPYLFIGGGAIVLNSNLIESSINVVKSYMIGGGLEVFLARKIGLSLEVSYGKQDILGFIAVNSTAIGGGVHFYFK